jgi:D-alanine-D-alanine ligase
VDLRSKYGKVAVVMGGDSSEREVSLMGGNVILQALLDSDIDAYKFDPKEQPIYKLKEDGYARAFLNTHGVHGEDGALQGALEYLQIPYTGSGVLASSVAMDKYRTKLIWQAFDIPMPRGQYVQNKKFNYNEFKLELDLPVIVKPSCGGSTVGLSKVYNLNELEVALNLAFKYDNAALIEEFIFGHEYTITVNEEKVYPVVKIEAPGNNYDYDHKYFSDDTVYLCPYDLGEIQPIVEKYARLGYTALGARGVSRLDFMIDKNNKIYFLELNTLPGMTGHSLVPMAFKASGIDFAGLCLHILDGAKLGV